MKYPALFIIFEKSGKILNCRLLQIIGGALRVDSLECVFVSIQRYKILCVVFGANHEVLYLMCPSYEMRDKWVKGLRYALQLDQYLKQKENSNMYPCYDTHSEPRHEISNNVFF